MIVVEVGANNGDDTKRFLDFDHDVYAFEPTPELHVQLKERFKNHPKYYPIPAAVDIQNRWAWFNIAGNCGGGCSSLHNFNPNINEIWNGRQDFVMTDRCRVLTMRLDTFMTVYNIPKIDFLWIDAQGNDFRVLKSLGDRIKDVVAGRCEVAYNVNLYDGEAIKNNCVEVGEWLQANGFEYTVTPHNHKQEADIDFKRIL